MSSRSPGLPPVTVFGPDALLSVTIESAGTGDALHLHAGGQGVWVSRMAAELGACPVLSTFLGGETGRTLGPLLDALPGELRVTSTDGASGSYVVDRREGERKVVAAAARPAPQRHEVDDLVSATISAALASKVLVVCNPYPPQGVPVEVYETIVAAVKAAGVFVIADLSSPRLEHALPYRPDLVKLNDWELAQFVCGPVDGQLLLEAANRLREAGAGAVVVTRAEKPIVVVPGEEEPFEIVPPSLPYGFREGCGDTMTGAIAAAHARGIALRDALVLGAAAGSANFLRHGLGTGKRKVVEELARQVQMRPILKTAA